MSSVTSYKSYKPKVIARSRFQLNLNYNFMKEEKCLIVDTMSIFLSDLFAAIQWVPGKKSHQQFRISQNIITKTKHNHPQKKTRVKAVY